MTGLEIVYAIVIISCAAFYFWMKNSKQFKKKAH